MAEKILFSTDIMTYGQGMIATWSDDENRPGEMAWFFHRLNEDKWSYSSFFFPLKTLRDFSDACGRYMTKYGGEYTRETFPPALMHKIACSMGEIRNKSFVSTEVVLRQIVGFKNSESKPIQLNIF